MAMNDRRMFSSVLIHQETVQRIEDFVFKIERLIIFTLILLSNLTPLCVVFLSLSNMFILIYCLFALTGLIISSLLRDCKFWLERIAMLLVVKQYLDPYLNYHHLAMVYFGLCNMVYLAQQKKFSQKCFFSGSSFGGYNPILGRTCFFGFRVAVFLLASLAFGTMLDLVIGNILQILVVSFAVPEILVNVIKPENLLHDFTYDTPETLNTRIVKSKDPECLFWIERVLTMLLLIVHDTDEIESTSYLAASLFAVTNTINFTNSIDFFVDIMISRYTPKNVVKAELKDKSPLKEALEAEVVKDPLKEASKETEAPREEKMKREEEKRELTATINDNRRPKAKLESERTLPEDIDFLNRLWHQIKADIENLRDQVRQLKSESEHNQAAILIVEQHNIKDLKAKLKDSKRLQADLESEKAFFDKEIDVLKQYRDEFEVNLENMRAEVRQLNSVSEQDQAVILDLEQHVTKHLTEKLKKIKKREAKIERKKTVIAENIIALERHREELKANLDNLRAEVRLRKSVLEHNQEMILIHEQHCKDWVKENRQVKAKIDRLTSKNAK